MKNFKSTITLMAFTLFLMISWSSNAQGRLSVEIPQENRASAKEASSNKKVTGKEYYKEIGGYLEVTAIVDKDGAVKLTSVTIPNTAKNQDAVAAGCPEGYRACAEACLDKPTTAAVALCTGYCVIKCIIESADAETIEHK
jgi:hypothetical protein